MFVTVSENWDIVHDNDTRVLIHFKLDEMQAQGKFIFNKINNYRSVYRANGSPIKIFTSIESANEYIRFYDTLNLTPISMDLNVFNNEDEVTNFLKSVMDPTHIGDPGPQPDDYNRVREKLHKS